MAGVAPCGALNVDRVKHYLLRRWCREEISIEEIYISLWAPENLEILPRSHFFSNQARRPLGSQGALSLVRRRRDTGCVENEGGSIRMGY